MSLRPAILKRLSRSHFAIAALAVAGLITFLAIPALVPRDVTAMPRMTATGLETDSGQQVFAQTHEVTIEQWNTCHDDGGCSLRLRPPANAPQVNYPATGLSWIDVNEYVVWISNRTRHDFRLPTRTEWAALAVEVLPETPDPIFTDPDLTWASSYLLEGLTDRRLRPSGAYSTTTNGISDMDGNVWEWTQDCYAGSDGAAAANACPAYFVEGEHQAVIPYLVRDPARGGCAVGAPPAHLGMRLFSDGPVPS